MTVEDKILLQLKKQFPGTLMELPEKFKMTDENGKTVWKYHKDGSVFYYSDKLRFYYNTYEKNLFENTLINHKKDFERAAGQEIKYNKYGVQKMAAIKSSSALLFNMLGDNDFIVIKGEIIPNGKYHLKYEKPLPAIDPRFPAYIDGYLENKRGVFIFIESKMLEYLQKPKNLKKSYLDCKKYQLWNFNSQAAESFQKLFRQICDESMTTANDEYKPKTTYDIFQILIHSMAILTYLLKKKENVKKVFLINTVWNIPKESDGFMGDLKNKYREYWDSEVKGAEQFSKDFVPEIQRIYKTALGNDVIFSFIFLRWSEFKDMIEMDEERKVYLKKYEL